MLRVSKYRMDLNETRCEVKNSRAVLAQKLPKPVIRYLELADVF